MCARRKCLVSYLVDIDLPLVLLDEPVGDPVGPDGGGAADGLAEVGVDGGASHRFKALHLPGGGDVDLRESERLN